MALDINGLNRLMDGFKVIEFNVTVTPVGITGAAGFTQDGLDFMEEKYDVTRDDLLDIFKDTLEAFDKNAKVLKARLEATVKEKSHTNNDEDDFDDFKETIKALDKLIDKLGDANEETVN